MGCYGCITFIIAFVDDVELMNGNRYLIAHEECQSKVALLLSYIEMESAGDTQLKFACFKQNTLSSKVTILPSLDQGVTYLVLVHHSKR